MAQPGTEMDWFETIGIVHANLSYSRIQSWESVQNKVTKLCWLACVLNRLAVTKCQRDLTEKEKGLRDLNRQKAGEIFQSLGFDDYSFSEEPKGYAIRVVMPNGASNSITGCWGIPEYDRRK